VSVVLIAVFSAFLLDRLMFYQEAAEKADMEYTANVLKVGLQLRIGELMARNQLLDYARIARENPVGWVDMPISGYRGEVSGPRLQSDLEPGWYFDPVQAQLIYVSRLHKRLTVSGSEASQVRWHVRPVYVEGARAGDKAAGAQLAPVAPYRWF
jgi:hypothetical protein